MLIEHELLPQPFEDAADDVEKIWWVGGVDHVEAMAKENDPGIEKQERGGDQILDEVTADPAQRRHRKAIDVDALQLLEAAGKVPLGRHHRHLEARVAQRQRLVPDAAIRRHGQVLDEEQDARLRSHGQKPRLTIR